VAPTIQRSPFEAGSVPENYRRYLEPVLFAPWAARLVAYAGVHPGDVVLDVAAGTGAVARVAARAAGSDGAVIASDLSAGMLEHAARRHVPRSARISTLLGPATSVDLPDGSVDVVLCQQGLPFMPDRVAVLRECLRVLRPGGTIAIAVWASGERLDPFDAYADALGESSAREVSNASLTMSVAGVVDAMLMAGFGEVRATRQSLVVRWPTLDAEIAGLFGTPFGPVVDGMESDDRELLLSSLRGMLAGDAGRTVDHVTTSVFGRGIRRA
jgi:SAM-dependent methyltransferase